MKIQSLSVVVPGDKCINHCEFCVSRMHSEPYKDLISSWGADFYRSVESYIKRLEFARDNGCNTLMLTGTIEPQQNKFFLSNLGFILRLVRNPFKAIEIQTTGVSLDEDYLSFLRDHVGVSLVSLSISSFDSGINSQICHMPESQKVSIFPLCLRIKEAGMSLRLSVNLTNYFEKYSPEEFFNICRGHGADQVTLRVLYSDGGDTSASKWVRENALSKSKVKELKDYVVDNGNFLGKLSHGACKYSLHNMSVVIDSNCMDKSVCEVEEDYKYLILRPDCHLYSRWDDPASLIY